MMIYEPSPKMKVAYTFACVLRPCFCPCDYYVYFSIYGYLIVFLLNLQILYVESKTRPGSIRIFRTQSPRHFEGGDWDQGGFCPRLKPLVSQEVNNLFKMYTLFVQASSNPCLVQTIL